MRLRAIIALAAVAVGSWLAAPAVGAASVRHAAREYPPTVCASLEVSTTNPLPGQTVTVAGTHFTPNASVRLELHSDPVVLGTVQANAGGAFVTHVKLPAGLTGTHTIVAATGAPAGGTCPPPTVGLSIQGQHTPPGTSFTGVDVLAMVLGAIALLGVGIALNRGARRSRRPTYANDI